MDVDKYFVGINRGRYCLVDLSEQDGPIVYGSPDIKRIANFTSSLELGSRDIEFHGNPDELYRKFGLKVKSLSSTGQHDFLSSFEIANRNRGNLKILVNT